MADKSVSELIAAQSVTPTDLFVLEQNGTAKKLTGQILENWLVSFADGHGGIQNIEKVSTSALVDTYRITLADTTTFDFVVTNGRSVNSITKTSTNGMVDTYTIQFNDNTRSTFTVTNGEKGDKGDNQYIWIKYASQKPTASSHSFGDVADNWIGVYSGESATAPTDWTQYEWFQIKGEKGDTGEPATLNSSSVEYQTSDSGTVIPSGAWSASVPVVAQGKYMWTRTTNSFNTGKPVVSYSVSRMGIDGSGSVSSVAGISPNSDGDVSLKAEDVGALPSIGGDLTGELKMNGQSISGLNAPAANDHAANMGFVNEQMKKAAPRNLLDNSDFRNPVNQRGQTSYSGSMYNIDRWRSFQNGNVVTVDNGCIRQTGTQLLQILDTNVIDKAKTYTLAACKVDGTIHIISGTFANQFSNAHLSCYIDTNTRCAYCVLLESDSYKWAALYEGEYTAETLPEYRSKGYGAELAECQRYFIKLAGSSTSVRGVGAVGSPILITPTFYLPTTMRTSPSVLSFDVSIVRGNGISLSSITPSVITSAGGVGNQIALSLTFSDNALNDMLNHIAVVYGNNLVLSADL
jgi:hypothetical protein